MAKAPPIVEISGLSRAVTGGDYISINFAPKIKKIFRYRISRISHQMALFGEAMLEKIILERDDPEKVDSEKCPLNVKDENERFI